MRCTVTSCLLARSSWQFHFCTDMCLPSPGMHAHLNFTFMCIARGQLGVPPFAHLSFFLAMVFHDPAYAITLNSDHNMCSCCILCISYVIGISNGVALGHCKSLRACRPLAFQIASHCLLGRIAVWHCVERGWNVWHCNLPLRIGTAFGTASWTLCKICILSAGWHLDCSVECTFDFLQSSEANLTVNFKFPKKKLRPIGWDHAFAAVSTPNCLKPILNL